MAEITNSVISFKSEKMRKKKKRHLNYFYQARKIQVLKPDNHKINSLDQSYK